MRNLCLSQQDWCVEIPKNQLKNSINEIKQISGLNIRQVRNALYKLTKTKKIVPLDRGKYSPVPNKSIGKRKKLERIKSVKSEKSKIGEIQQTVYKVIKRRRTGVRFKVIIEQTGLDNRQVRNSIYHLTQKGLIATVERGKYIAL